jgi:hypothetical protein
MNPSIAAILPERRGFLRAKTGHDTLTTRFRKDGRHPPMACLHREKHADKQKDHGTPSRHGSLQLRRLRSDGALKPAGWRLGKDQRKER